MCSGPSHPAHALDPHHPQALVAGSVAHRRGVLRRRSQIGAGSRAPGSIVLAISASAGAGRAPDRTAADPNQRGTPGGGRARRDSCAACDRHIDCQRRPGAGTGIEGWARCRPMRAGGSGPSACTSGPPASSKPSGRPGGAAWTVPRRAAAARSSAGASRLRCCPWPSATGWASWCGPARAGTAHRAHPPGSADRPAPHRHVQPHARRAPPRYRREDHPAGGRGGPARTHLAVAFTIAHPGVTSAIIGPSSS